MPDAFRIDTHHHFAPPDYIAKVNPMRPLGRVVAGWTPERSLEDMDRSAVATSVLSITTPGLWFDDAIEARRLARSCNDYAAELFAEHPGRFGLFAAVPMPDVEGTLAEIAYALDELGADGVGLFTSYGTTYLGDAAFTAVFAELDRRGAVVYVHPTCSPCTVGLVPGVSESAIEFGTDTTRAIASLVFSGTASRYRNIQFIFSHAGGTMPFLIGRFAQQAQRPELAARLPEGVVPELQRFYYDTAQAANRGAMSSLRELVTPDHVLFGTDFPYQSAAGYVSALPTCGFSAAELRGIERENALRLLPKYARP